MFRLEMFEVKEPQKLARELKSDKTIKSVWIPQTLGDQIWYWLEFKDQADKNEYIKWVENCDLFSIGYKGEKFYPKNMFMHNEKHFDQEQVDYWTKNY